MPNVAMKHEIDPKDKILQEIGSLKDFEVGANDVLLAIYLRPEKTAGRIVLTQRTLEEDLYQSKAHLVLKVGENVNDWGTMFLSPMEWVVVRPSDCWDIHVNFVPCRMARVTEFERPIRARIRHPDQVW